ncbi:hypothetical protein ACHQM5_000707 [Ranunculus cassubicifolius]
MTSDLVTFLHDALDRVAHTTSVEAFYHQFAAIRYLVESSQPWLTESYFASRFIYGLQEDFQIFVIRFHPVTVTAAYQLASIYEESIYLHYFPESVMQNDDFFVENSVAGNHLVVPCIDKTCEEVVVEAFSSVSTSSIADSGSDLVEESTIDNPAGGTAVVSQSEDTLDSLVVYEDQRMNIVSSSGVNEGGNFSLDCMVELVPTTVESHHNIDSMDNPRLPSDRQINDMWVSGCLVHCKIRHQIIYLSICCSWMNVFLSNCFKKNASSATTFINSNCDKTVGVVPLEVDHFYFLWEPGSLASEWQVDKIWRQSGNVGMKSFSPLPSSSQLQTYIVHMIEQSQVQCLCTGYDGAVLVVDIEFYAVYPTYYGSLKRTMFQLHGVLVASYKVTGKVILWTAAARECVYRTTNGWFTRVALLNDNDIDSGTHVCMDETISKFDEFLARVDVPSCRYEAISSLFQNVYCILILGNIDCAMSGPRYTEANLATVSEIITAITYDLKKKTCLSSENGADLDPRLLIRLSMDDKNLCSLNMIIIWGFRYYYARPKLHVAPPRRVGATHSLIFECSIMAESVPALPQRNKYFWELNSLSSMLTFWSAHLCVFIMGSTLHLMCFGSRLSGNARALTAAEMMYCSRPL